MKAFFRKHRFKILVTILSLILIYVCFYMLWVHIPYTKHQNELTSIQESICDKYNYTYNYIYHKYFLEYLLIHFDALYREYVPITYKNKHKSKSNLKLLLKS